MTVHVGGFSVRKPRDRLIEQWVYFVDVASFTFEFHSVEQLHECLAFFSRKIHPSSIQPDVDLEHYWQRWHEKLPQWLFEEPKRLKVVAALERAAADFQQSSK